MSRKCDLLGRKECFYKGCLGGCFVLGLFLIGLDVCFFMGGVRHFETDESESSRSRFSYKSKEQGLNLSGS